MRWTSLTHHEYWRVNQPATEQQGGHAVRPAPHSCPGGTSDSTNTREKSALQNHTTWTDLRIALATESRHPSELPPDVSNRMMDQAPPQNSMPVMEDVTHQAIEACS